MDSTVIYTVAAVIADVQGRVLLVRKRGSLVFIQPGGKRQSGESSLETLARELREELGVEMRVATAQRLGEYEADAVNEPGRRVRAETFLVDVDGVAAPGAEIEEIRWVDPGNCAEVPIAPLSRHRIFPSMAWWLKQRRKKLRKERLREPVMRAIILAGRCISFPVLIPFVLLALPLVGNVLVITLAQSLGCRTGEDAIHPCALGPWQIGELVNGYNISAFLAGGLNPLLAGAAFVAFLKHWTGTLWLILVVGSLAARWIRGRQLLSG